MRSFLFCFAVLVACSSGSSSGSTVSPGSPCVDHTSCGSDLYCLIETDTIEGKCESFPAACNGSGECDCLDEVRNTKCGGNGRCSFRSGQGVFACGTAVRRKEGEACSTFRSCEAGLLCRVAANTRLGTCAKPPASCGTGLTCECLKAEGCQGGSTFRECSIFGNEGSIVCE